MSFLDTNSHLRTKPYNFDFKSQSISEIFDQHGFLRPSLGGGLDFFIIGWRIFQRERVLWGWLAGPFHMEMQMDKLYQIYPKVSQSQLKKKKATPPKNKRVNPLNKKMLNGIFFILDGGKNLVKKFCCTPLIFVQPSKKIFDLLPQKNVGPPYFSFSFWTAK